MSSKNNLIIVILLAVLVTGLLGYYFYLGNKPKQAPEVAAPPQSNVAENPTTPVIPTRTPEEIKIIAQIKDYNIDITGDGFTPAFVEIKTNDQVFFTNKDSVIHKVQGEDWGGVPIGPNERFVQAFEKPGTYSYTDEDNPTLKGTIVVK